MKREYKKPYLIAEPYQLDAAVASTCTENGSVSINHYQSSCSFEGYFYAMHCEEDVVNGECYHGPMASSGITFTYS